MNPIAAHALEGCRFVCTRLTAIGRDRIGEADATEPQDQRHPLGLRPDYTHQAASDFLRARLRDDAPCLICRFGSTELRTITTYLSMQREARFPGEKVLSYVIGRAPEAWWSHRHRHSMSMMSGFFPPTDRNLTAFSRMMLSRVPGIDVLGTWGPRERLLGDRLADAAIVRLKDLRPWVHRNPWSVALENRTVLVVHPFAETIRAQYRRRDRLFADPRVLPRFRLETLAAVQSIAGNKTPFSNWFEALSWMQEEIAKIDFDIAIIGAGAYGLPLASFVKSLGRKAVHLGGITQLLFGIVGARWEQRPRFESLRNEYWVRPLASETPPNHEIVEDGCYW